MATIQLAVSGGWVERLWNFGSGEISGNLAAISSEARTRVGRGEDLAGCGDFFEEMRTGPLKTRSEGGVWVRRGGSSHAMVALAYCGV